MIQKRWQESFYYSRLFLYRAEEENKMNFADTLRKLRKENNMTQEELAKFLNVSSQAISKWETSGGYPDVSLLPRISSFFGISIDELLGVSELKSEIHINAIHEMWERNNRIQNHEENIELLRQAIKLFPGDFLQSSPNLCVNCFRHNMQEAA